jgi:hypothetical protein
VKLEIPPTPPPHEDHMDPEMSSATILRLPVRSTLSKAL